MENLLHERWLSTPIWVKVILFAALPAAGFGLARFLDGYRSWLALGPGGLPYNLRGYMNNLYLTAALAKHDTKSVEVYDQPERSVTVWAQASDVEKAAAVKSFLNGPLPQRNEPQSEAAHWAIPQRERSAGAYLDPKLKAAYLKAFQNLSEKHSETIEWKLSEMERRGQAMFLKETYAVPTLISRCKGEVAHIHDSDVSGHVLLSLADAEDVVAKGWGERHRLSGTAFIPLSYTMLYVPRNDEEIEISMMIAEAAIEYAKSNGRKT